MFCHIVLVEIIIFFEPLLYLFSVCDFLIYYKDGGGNTTVYDYNRSTWNNEAYRTIVLDEPATGDVLAFLEANATKLS